MRASTTARPRLLLQAMIVKDAGHIHEDDLGLALIPAWRRLLLERRRNRRFLDDPASGRVDELIVRAYARDGWTCDCHTGGHFQVRHHMFGAVRFVHDVTVCAPSGAVTVDDIQPLLGALAAMPEPWTGVASTSADFAPGLHHHRLVIPFLPARLALRHRGDVLTWLTSAVARLQGE